MKLVMLPIVLLSLVTSGCKHPANHERSLPSAPQPAHSVVDFARVADAREATLVKTVTYKGTDVRLAEVRRFKIAKTSLAQTAAGAPALEFELVEGDKKAFADWTGSIVGKGMVVLVDGEPVMLVTVASRLTGVGVINFGSGYRTPEEVRALGARLVERP